MPSDPVPPLKVLHPDEALSKPKLIAFERMSTESLMLSLLPNQKDSLKVRPDGTILDGHHRIKILRSRGVDVDGLPREVVSREEP
jgi:hypothetical protein